MNGSIMLSALIVAVTTATGCVHSGATSFSESPSAAVVQDRALADWLSEKALPYIEWETEHHQWLKGRVLDVVPMEDGAVTPTANALTLEFRKAIIDRLARAQRVALAWEGPVRWQRHHSSLSILQCEEIRPAAAYIGIETRLSPITNHLQIDIRALDRNEGWIPGFAICWSGKAGAAELLAMQHTQPAENLIGLRLPAIQGGSG